jgi:hypothetical protein
MRPDILVTQWDTFKEELKHIFIKEGKKQAFIKN